VTGCACDIFWAAPLVRPPLQLEETCPATGTPIRVVFTPCGVEHAEPAGAIMAMLRPQECKNAVETAGDIGEVDASFCAQMPLFASAEAAQGWLAAHPGGEVLPVRQAWDLSGLRDLQDKMSTLLNLDH
jgi:alkylmercury lyase